MKKIALATIFALIIATSLVKNSTKEIEDKIFSLNENIRPLKSKLGDELLEYSFLSSPEKLIKYQSKYFEKDLIKIEIMNIKEIIKNNETLEIKDLISKNENEQ